MIIEPATLEDLDALVEAWAGLAREQLEHGSHVDPQASRDAIRELFGQAIVTGDVLVARGADGEERENGTDGEDPGEGTSADSELYGFVTVDLERGHLHQDVTRGVVPYLYVNPDRRDEGVGRSLLEAAESRLTEIGADVVSLDVMTENEAAQRFYRRHGYRSHRVTMEKSLPDENDTHSKDDR
jgi:ribosomal protein S18 acetylase RimI-like enzyme